MDCHFRDLPDFFIIMRKRCSIQQGEKITVHQSKVLKKLTVPFLGGPLTNEKLMANPENDSP